MLVKNDKRTSQNTKMKIFDDDQEKKRENMKEIDLERKKSIHERLGPLTPLREYSSQAQYLGFFFYF